ncbi:MAG: imidazole glycerol phosphate synthase subunit HisH [Terrimicrobiaceae bacterium]
MKDSPNIALVDYGSGNLRSVEKALEACGARVVRATGADALSEADAIVVPGVGAFGDCANNLRSAGLWEPVGEWLRSGKPYLGICLGYQLLFESSEESPGVSGWGVLPGRVVRFRDGDLKVPHMGWNMLRDLKGPLFPEPNEVPWVYFVHSYYPAPEDTAIVSSFCDYGVRFAASVSTGRIHATQFHPEKSQACGLEVLRGFLSTL